MLKNQFSSICFHPEGINLREKQESEKQDGRIATKEKAKKFISIEKIRLRSNAAKNKNFFCKNYCKIEKNVV